MKLTPTEVRWLSAAVVTVSYLALCGWIFWRAHQQRQRQRAQDIAREQALRQAAAAADASEPILVAWASQTGQAQQLAEQTAAFLEQRGQLVRLCALNALDAPALRHTRRALFVASTYGEGDAPDSASVFFSQIMRQPLVGEGSDAACAPLRQLRFGTLALGDAQYAQFCGFARALDAWLQAQGAQSWFERIEVNTPAPEGAPDSLGSALAQWQQHIVQWVLGAHDEQPSASTSAKTAQWHVRGVEAGGHDEAVFGLKAEADFSVWRITRRERLNAGSQGQGVWLLDLLPADPQTALAWESGDLLEIHTEGDGGHPRSYSIANVPEHGCVQLLVRQALRTDGTPGHTSTALCVGLPVQAHTSAGCSDAASLRARIKPHLAFRLGGNVQRPLILIGNGTGLAGLRSHLQARALHMGDVTMPAPCWLLFGERQRHCDSLLHAELLALKERGVIERMDWAFSRDVDAHGQPQRVYVQDCVRTAAQELRQWVHERDAAIYVCGSLKGMAAGVDEALREVLGTQAVDALLTQGRYRRDVY